MCEMRDSGFRYLGAIPSTWPTRRLKHFFVVSRVTGRADATVLSLYRDHGIVPKDSRDDNHNVTSLDTSKYKYVEVGDFVINKMKGWQGSMALSGYEGIVSPAYHVFKITASNLVPSYAHYLLRCQSYADEWRRLSTGLRIGQWDLHVEDFLNASIPVPPLDEQQRIADFLDAKCAEIDRAIEAAEGSIEEYKAYKGSIVSRAVTKGLDKHVEMKDSGIEWLGWIPAHWSKTPIKRMFYISKTIAGKTGFDVLSITQRGLKVKDITSGEGQLAADYSNYQIVEPGDFAMNLMDLLTGWIDVSDRSGVTSPDYRVFKARRENIDKRYYLRVFQYYYFGRIFYGFCKGISSKGRWRLPADAFRNMQAPVPPLDEQRRIAYYLDERCAQIDRAISAKKSIIADHKANKQSLIYEVVTGKREV